MLRFSLPTTLAIVPCLFASSKSIPYFKTVGPTQVLTVNLNRDADKDTLIELKKFAQAELRKKHLAPSRQNELRMITALSEYRSGNFEAAAASFDPLLADTNLGEHASYFQAYAKLKAAQGIAPPDPDRSFALCDEARKSLATLMGNVSTQAALYRKGYYESGYCVAQALVGAGRKAEALDFIPKLLDSWIEIRPAQAQSLYTALLDLYLEQKKIDLAKQTLLNAKKSLADPSWTTLYEFNHPEIKSPAPAQAIANPTPSGPPYDPKLEKLENDWLARAEPSKREKKYEELIAWTAQSLRGQPLLERSDKILPALQRAVSQALQAPSDALFTSIAMLPSYMQYKIARTIWEDGYDAEAARIFEQISAIHARSDEAPYSLFFLGRIAEDRQNWPQAIAHLEKLASEYPSAVFFNRAVFKLGWLSYMAQRDKEAIRWLSHATTLADHPNQKAEAYYWLHKTYLRLEEPVEAKRFIDLIEQECPLSFYAFLTGKMPKIERKPVRFQYGLAPEDEARLMKIRALFSVGLLDDAARSLDDFNSQQDPGLSSEIIGMLTATRRYLPAIILAYNAIHDTTPPTVTESLVHGIFPLDYQRTVESQAKAQRLDPELLYALIKQESAYDEQAVSKVGALGLMQLMLPTAQALARSLRQPSVTRADLLGENRNIALGAKYVRNLIDQFDGNVIYAIAAYNAGPSKVNQWRKNWGNLPDEAFLELIPFDETRNYVKLVLRNYAFYAKMNRRTVPASKIFATTRS